MSGTEQQMVRVCRLIDLPRRRGRMVSIGDVEIALFRVGDSVHAVDNVCPHQHAPVIADGLLQECVVTCPLHGNEYDVRTGERVGASGAGLATHRVELRGEDVWVEAPVERPPSWW